MGMRRCSRKECENVLCDTYIYSVGYVCRNCIIEFKNYLNQNGLTPSTDEEIAKDLKRFVSFTTIDEFFNERTI